MVVALIDLLLVLVLTSIANEIATSGSVVDRLIASACDDSIANVIASPPSGSGVDRTIASVLLTSIADLIVPICLVSIEYKILTGFRHLIVMGWDCTWIDTS